MKILRFIILSCIILTVFACSNKKNNNAKIIWEKYENGNYKVVHQYFTDTADLSEDHYYQEYYENGSLKIQGLENQGRRKGEWNFYYDNGKIKAKTNFDNGTLNGAIILFDETGEIIAQDIVRNGELKENNDEVIQFIKDTYILSEISPTWTDSLYLMVDSLRTLLKEK